MPDTKYLIDSCSLITPYKTIYRMSVFPSFWDNIKQRILDGEIVICQPVYDEICSNKDQLSNWLKSIVDGTNLVQQIDESVLTSLSCIHESVLNRVPPYRESAIRVFNSCADQFVLAFSKAYGYTIITEEVPALDSVKNVKLANVCISENINYLKIYDFLSTKNIVL